MTYEKKEEDILASLLAIPKRSLETKIKELEELQNNRSNISSENVTNLLNHQNELKVRSHLLRYQIHEQNSLLSQIWQLETFIQKEHLNHFHDIKEINEKLQDLREERDLNKMKEKFLK